MEDYYYEIYPPLTHWVGELGWSHCSFLFFFFLFSSAVSSPGESHLFTRAPCPAGVWVILPTLQLRTHHIGQAPGPAGASPHLPKLPAGAAEASGRVGFEATADAAQTCHRESWNEFGGARQ
jgi:hypothetical protein